MLPPSRWQEGECIMKNLTKINSSYKYDCYNVGRTDMWGNYCPETGEYYLAHNTFVPGVGECVEVLASARYVKDDEWQESCCCGYSYEVVRELLQLGHLTTKTLEQFQQAGGEVWWNQPYFH